MRSRREEFVKTVLPQEEAGKTKGITMEFLNCPVAHCATKGQHKTQKNNSFYILYNAVELK